jgi:UDP-N-acetyl-D-galactosamine dehydrogenase
LVSSLYRSIIPAGVYVAKGIAVAEAAKVVENTQRDLNIALMNELSIVFKNLGINIYDVIEAASTKWNFHPYTPGLVGGHCISVDPYYLLYKSEMHGYSPNLIHTSRRINEGMSTHVANLARKFFSPYAKLLIIGFTFKANCADIRNSKVADLYIELLQRGFMVDVYDSMADKSEVYQVYRIRLNDEFSLHGYSGIVYAVDHRNSKEEFLHAIHLLNIPVLDLTGGLRAFIDDKLPYETL